MAVDAVEEVEALREAWEALPVANPAADPDHLMTLIEHSPPSPCAPM